MDKIDELAIAVESRIKRNEHILDKYEFKQGRSIRRNRRIHLSL